MSVFGNRLRQELHGNRFWCGLVMVQWLIIVGLSLYYEWRNSQALRVCVVNGATYYIGSANPTMAVKEMHKELAKLVTVAAFTRTWVAVVDPQTAQASNGPNGSLQYPLWETLSRIVNTPTLKAIQTAAEKDKDVFVTEQITQDFNITRDLVEQEIDQNKVKILIDGDLIQVARIEGRVETQSRPVRVMMILQRNDSFASNNKYPMVCIALQTEYL